MRVGVNEDGRGLRNSGRFVKTRRLQMLHDWFEHINSVNSDEILINHDPSIVFP